MGMGLGSGMGVGMMGMGAFQNLFSSGSNGYMLLYRRVDPLRNQPEPSKESIPESLKMIFEEDSEKKQLEVEERIRDREMVTIRVTYIDTTKQFKIHKKQTVNDTKLMAKKTFNIENIEDNCLRLREHGDVPGKPLPDETATLEDLRFFPLRTLYLEAKKENEEFPEYDPRKMLLRLFYYYEEENKWSELNTIYIDKDAKLLDLKNIIQEIYKLSHEDQVVTIEYFNRYNAKVLIKNKYLRKEYRVNDGKKIWIERRDPQMALEEYKYDKFGQNDKNKKNFQIHLRKLID